MKKFHSLIILTLFLTLFFTCVCYAQGDIVERPDVKIIIEGKLITYQDIPLWSNSHILLPLRDTLRNLGVKDDDIIWNSSDKSVTIKKDSVNIYLRQGSNIAYVNDSPVTLEVSPVGYNKNDRIYVPARFVSQSLGKKVIWDGLTSSVLIKDENEFDNVKSILDKSIAAMKEISKGKLSIRAKVNMEMNNIITSATALATGEVDSKKRIVHNAMKISMMGGTVTTESYLADNMLYITNPLTGRWDKQSLTKEQFDKAYDQNSLASLIGANDTLCAGLMLQTGTGGNGILLEGDTFLDSLVNKITNVSFNTNDFEFQKSHIKIDIDTNTYLVNSVSMEVYGDTVALQGKSPMNINIDINYLDYDGNFDVNVPEDIVKNAVEKKDDILN